MRVRVVHGELAGLQRGAEERSVAVQGSSLGTAEKVNHVRTGNKDAGTGASSVPSSLVRARVMELLDRVGDVVPEAVKMNAWGWGRGGAHRVLRTGGLKSSKTALAVSHFFPRGHVSVVVRWSFRKSFVACRWLNGASLQQARARAPWRTKVP